MSAHGVVRALRDETAIRELDELLRQVSERATACEEDQRNEPETNLPASSASGDSKI